MSSDANFELDIDVSGTSPPAALTATQSLARVFMAEGNGRYTVILPHSSAALALKSGATDGTKPEKQDKAGKGGMGRMGCNGLGRCNGSCLDRGGKTCNGGIRAGADNSAAIPAAIAAAPEEPPKKNRVLVDLHSALHHTVRVSRHSVVLVDLAKAPESLKKGSRVVGTIISVVQTPEVWCKADYWPYAPYEVPKDVDNLAGRLPPSDTEDEEEQ
ncbi:hypothetical protein SEPCBS119000_004268 [Sporothrix epigloea]|uniref:S1 motif domain-containing protein n=1 Tax=Sporothrix epigloea TaxID=1892477 RepID=A0ABP0DRD7_9PEZI